MSREQGVDPLRPRASLRTAVVWDVLSEALDGQAAAAGRESLDVLDAGGGTGNFAVRAAGMGHRVTVVDPSPDALFALERRAAEAGVADLVRGVQGDAHGLLDVVGAGAHDAVLCHGVLEYVDDPAEAVHNVVGALRPTGVVSVLAANRNGAVLARALAGHFAEARRGLSDPHGRWGDADPVPRRFTEDGLADLVTAAGLEVAAVHGVRVFADLVPGSLADAEPGATEALLQLEEAAAGIPAFRAIATQLHLLARRGREA
ncbi:methyltransferase domain-containing protein [Streptomyces sp. SCUT-3]|uniref:methyltransferase n=1 Tax=Streptomyces sp. SCUT-3 TaxID=2684469 RepID=UPI0015F867D9|nr:methyltransferase [Streptomyces sp. SCUT-3]QMV23810.1 methyltransferase domain-containing protein [Streptomyces sp. SCUT-3]